MTLEDEFQHEMIRMDDEVRALGYSPNIFRRMLDEHGGVETARRLLAQPGVQQGLMKLWKMGRLDLSLEASVIKERYRPLFTEGEINEARARLEALDYFKKKRGEK